MNPKKNLVAFELLMMTILFAALSVIAVFIEHRRSLMMIVLTLLMALMTFFARFRSRRHKEIKTLHTHAQRKRTTHSKL